MKRSLRSILALALVLVTLVVSGGTVMAETTTPTPANQAEVHGAVSAIVTTVVAPATTPTITITPKEGPAVTLNVGAATLITKAGIGTTTLDKLAVGDRANATYDKTTLIAATISARPPIKDYSSVVGQIKSMTTTGLVVTTKKADVTVTVNADTKYKAPGVKDAALANFKVGDKVAVLSVASGGANVALHIVLIPGKPVFAVRVGTVDSYTANTSITVKGVKGDATTFAVNTNTKVRMERGVTAIAVGQRVIVNAKRDPATDQYTATSIMVFGAKGQGKP